MDKRDCKKLTMFDSMVYFFRTWLCEATVTSVNSANMGALPFITWSLFIFLEIHVYGCVLPVEPMKEFNSMWRWRCFPTFLLHARIKDGRRIWKIVLTQMRRSQINISILRTHFLRLRNILSYTLVCLACSLKIDRCTIMCIYSMLTAVCCLPADNSTHCAFYVRCEERRFMTCHIKCSCVECRQ